MMGQARRSDASEWVTRSADRLSQMLSDERKNATARLVGAWASEVADRATKWASTPNHWVQFVRRMPSAHVVDDLTVLFYDVVADALDSGPLLDIPVAAGVEDGSAEHFTLLLKRGIWTIQLVAAPYEVQRDAWSLTPFVHVPTEVCEEFYEIQRWVLPGGFLNGILTHEQEAAVAAVDAAITEGIDCHVMYFFRHEAMRTSPHWEAVRVAAARALALVGVDRQPVS